MTKNQINYIVTSVLNDELDKYVPLINNFMIVVSKEENLYTDESRYRFKFDSSNEILEKIQIKKFSESDTDLPDHDNYTITYVKDTAGNIVKTIVYEFITNEDGTVMTDYYSYDSIIAFIPKSEVRI